MNINRLTVFSRLIPFGVMIVALTVSLVSGVSAANAKSASEVSQGDVLDSQKPGNQAITAALNPTLSVSDSCGGPVINLSGVTTSRYSSNSVANGTIFDRTAWYSDAVGNGTNGAFSVGNSLVPPVDVCVFRGVINGHIPLSLTWDEVHTFGGYGDQTFTGRLVLIDGARVYNVEDGWKPRELPEFGNTGIMQMRNTYMTGIRDDSIENDNFMPGFVEDSLFDGVDTFLSEQNQSGVTPSTLGPNEDPYIRVTRVYVRLYSTNSDGNSNPGRWFKWQPRGTINHNLIITDSVFATHGPAPRDGWSALNFPPGTTFAGTNYVLWLGTPGGYGATIPAGVIFLEGQAAIDKWNQVRNTWLITHGYDARPLDDFNPMDDPVVAPVVDVSTPVNTSTPTATPAISLTNTPMPTNTFTPAAAQPFSANPLYLSLTSSQTIAGISSSDEDIWKFDGQNWSLFFDGSDVGVASPDLFAFSLLDSDSILMSFSSAVMVNGISVTPQDVVRFDAISLGSNTAGAFSMYFDGSDVGFDTTSENIDSVSLLPDGRVLISTTGSPSVAGVSGKDEDVLAFTPTSLGDVTNGSWAMYFDGSDVGLADTSNEDVDALDVVGGNLYLSTMGDFAVSGVAGFDEDVFICVPTSLGDVTACNYLPSFYFDGSTWGLSGNDVDAFNFLMIGAVSTSTPGTMVTAPLGPSPTPTNTAIITSTPASPTTFTSTPTASNVPAATATSTSAPMATLTLTPAPVASNTPTQPALDLILADSFESGSFSAWISASTGGSDLSVSPSAALVGSNGMQVLINDTTNLYVNDDTPNAESHYRARFYFDPNSLSMTDGSAQYIFSGYDTSAVFQVDFRFSAGSYQIRLRQYNDGGSVSSTNWATISDVPHSIEVEWRAATAAGANDGAVSLWINGVLSGNLTGVDNDTRRIDSVKLGAVAGIDAGTLGTYFMDAFESRRQTYIGP